MPDIPNIVLCFDSLHYDLITIVDMLYVSRAITRDIITITKKYLQVDMFLKNIKTTIMLKRRSILAIKILFKIEWRAIYTIYRNLYENTDVCLQVSILFLHPHVPICV